MELAENQGRAQWTMGHAAPAWISKNRMTIVTLPRTHGLRCDQGTAGGHGAEAAARTFSVSDAKTVQRDSGSCGRLRILGVDARQEGECRESAQASAEDWRTGSGRMLPDSWHSGGRG